MFWNKKSKDERTLERAKKLLKYPNTFGYKIENNKLIVHVERKVSEDVLTKDQIIPKYFDGYRTDVVEAELPKTFSIPNQNPQPLLLGGISIGESHKITAGTLGVIYSKPESYILKTYDGKEVYRVKAAAYNMIKYIAERWFTVEEVPKYFALTNEHVSGNVGTHIVHPGRLDSNRGRIIGRTVKVSGMKTNNVDAAIIELTETNVKAFELLGHLYELKGFNVNLPSVNSRVYKIGRTTGKTSGYIRNNKVASYVKFHDGSVVLFTNLLEIQTTLNVEFSAGGDSGSVIFNMEDEIVGLLFAGSSNRTLAIPIDRVIKNLNI